MLKVGQLLNVGDYADHSDPSGLWHDWPVLETLRLRLTALPAAPFS